MTIHEGYEGLSLKNPVVTLGIFDGVHTGHRRLLDRLVSHAMATGSDSVVITFNPHPRLVLSETRAGLSFLTTLDEKKILLGRSGIGYLLILEFNQQIRNMGACEFIKDILVDRIGIKHLIVGYDHHFGRQREGDFATISGCAAKYGFTVEKVEEVMSGNVAVSSTAIRDALLSGRLEEANGFLGYSYFLSGTVVHGRGIGKSIGFPTANILPSDEYKLIPADGVYAVEIELDSRLLKGMLSIGSNPTVNNDPGIRSIEAHIFDLDRDLYDRQVKLIFRHRLRNEKKYGSLRRLARQMELDRKLALKLLG